MASKLTPEMRDAVLARRAAGQTAKQCVEWLHREHGIDVTIAAVTKLTRVERRERGNDAKATVRGSLKRTLPKDLEFLQRILRDYRRLYARQMRDALADPVHVEPVHKTVETIRRLVDLSLHYSGADTP